MSVIIYILSMFLSVIGLCEIIHFLSLVLFDTKSNKTRIVCCILEGKTADIDLQFVVEQYRWMGRKYADKIFAINSFNDDNEVLNRCREIADRNGIEIISFEEIKRCFEEINEPQ